MYIKIRKLLGIFIFFAFVTIVVYLTVSQNKKQLLNDINYQSLNEIVNNEEDCFVVVYSTYCASCQKLKKDLSDVIETEKYKIYGINIDEMKDNGVYILKQYEMQGVPFIIHFKKGIRAGLLHDDISNNRIKEFFNDGSISTSRLNVVYFFSPTCSSCARTSDYLEKIAKDNSIIIKKYNITSIENMDLLNDYCDEYGVEENMRGSVPIVFLNTQYLIGADIQGRIKDIINEKDGITTSEIKKINENGLSKGAFLANIDCFEFIINAFLNGLNPCSLSMLIFLLILLEEESREILKLGLAFCTGKFLMLILLGTLLYKLLGSINSTIIVNIIDSVMLVILLVLAMLNMNDYFMIKKGEFGNIKAQLPERVRKYNHKIIEETINRFSDYRMMVVLSVLLGSVIAFTEFLCSGQIYLFSIIKILHTYEKVSVQAFLYLVVYNIFCVLPIIIVVLLVARGKRAKMISYIFSERIHYVKLIYAFLFFAFAIKIISNIIPL